MLYTLDFAIAGLVILIILFFFIITLYNQEIETIIQLRSLILFLIIADVFDIVTAITISYPDSVPIWFNYILNIAFFEFEVICISLFPKYIRAIIKKPKSIFERINNVLVGVYAVVCASSPLTHSIFYFDNNGKYTHGFLYFLIFIIPLYFLTFSLITMLINKKAFSKKQYYTVIGFVLCAIAGPFLQALLPGNRIIDFFALSVAAFLAVLGLETPDFLRLEKALKELEENKELLETAKKNEEERNKLVHEMTKSASWTIHMDTEHNIVYSFWSDEFFWMLGYEKDETDESANLWADSLHPDEAEKVLDDFLGGIEGIKPFDLNYRLRNKKGEYRWYRGTGELVINDDGSAVYHGIIRDIKDEKIKDDLTKEKLAALDELEKSQEALKKALERAEAADQAKSDFLANMSHEIRTPINAVLGMNEMISRESTESQILKYSANVADAGNTLLSLINDILDFSKIEAGKMEINPAEYELSDLLREVYNIMNVRFGSKELDFIIKINPDIPNKLLGDEVRIRQILINILNNAWKYTDKGSVTLKIDYQKNDDDKIMLTFASIDTGIGIKEEDLPTLFKAFARIDLVHNRKKEGTGLGLSITSSFVELMGGTIDVSSKYGEGSVFTINIPQIVKEETSIGQFDVSTASSNSQKYEAGYSTQNARILAVDDIVMNLEIIKGLLKGNGLEVDIAESGKACLTAVAEKEYDIILLDHMMPELDGVETMKLIKADSTHPNQNTPVIMLTANAIIGAKEEYLKQGFSDYLSKPINPKELDSMIIKYMPKEKLIVN